MKKSKVTDAPCSLELSSVDMNFLQAAQKGTRRNCQSRALPGTWLRNVFSVVGDLCIPRLLDSGGKATLKLVLVLQCFCASATAVQNGNVGSRTFQGTVACSCQFDLPVQQGTSQMSLSSSFRSYQSL